MRSVNIIIFLTLIYSASCDSHREKYPIDKSISVNEYATNFNVIEEAEGYKVLRVVENWSGKETIRDYKLIPADEFKGRDVNENEISVPPERVVCMSTSHIAYISALGKAESIKAVSGAKYISDSTVIQLFKDGEISDIGFESSLNYEALIALSPDIVFTYGISGENNIYIEKIKALGIKVIAVGDYMENHPLGKAEYLKFFGALYNCSEKADSLFTYIREEYLQTKSRAEQFGKKRKVLLNAPWKDVWYIPGEDSYMSRLIKDAGGEVLGCKKGEFHSYPNSIEEVFKLSYNADLWLNPNNFQSISELLTSNPLFGKIAILSKGKVFNNTKRNTETGGSDFWERGVVEPHLILKDLINILHTNDTLSINLKYYKMLN
jgi:iron complex transport system substrate-binding protein